MKSAVTIIILLIFFSCTKDGFITSPDASLSTSSDTLAFDTVFTNVGSITQSFKVFNNNSQKLKISSIRLAGGPSSAFKINIDGVASPQVSDIEIDKNDSIYIFVQVNIDPTSSTLPFVLRDSIQINYNGNNKWVQLQAYGQNAIFYKNKIIDENTTWTNTLPYVILGGIQVDTGKTLQIEAGTKIYLHADAPFLVDGTLIVRGTKNEPVIFAGDRLDADYKDLPAGWPGIYFRNTSENNSLVHSMIKNAYQGLVVQSLAATPDPKLQISRSIIHNVYDAGIVAINSNIQADNCLIFNCGKNISLQSGGHYRFINCTVASFGNLYISHVDPVLSIYNYLPETTGSATSPLNAVFQNCIFWGEGGTVDNEVALNKEGSTSFEATFDHCLYKAKDEIANASFISSIKNETPQFDSVNISKNIYDFHFKNHANSPAIDAGMATPFLYDLDDKKRGGKPDIGCYER